MNKIVCAVLIALLITACLFWHANSVKNELIAAQDELITNQEDLILVSTIMNLGYYIAIVDFDAGNISNWYEFNQKASKLMNFTMKVEPLIDYHIACRANVSVAKDRYHKARDDFYQLKAYFPFSPDVSNVSDAY